MRPQTRHKPGSSRGFTLFEILIVVAVVVIIASTIMLNLSFNRPADLLRDHAGRVGKTLQLLMQEAILDDRNFALSLAPGAFQVLEYSGKDWTPTEDAFLKGLAREHDYKDQLLVNNQLVNVEKTEQPRPHILILSNGEMTVFQWDINDEENRLRMRLQSDLLGRIVMEGPSGTLL